MVQRLAVSSLRLFPKLKKSKMALKNILASMTDKTINKILLASFAK